MEVNANNTIEVSLKQWNIRLATPLVLVFLSATFGSLFFYLHPEQFTYYQIFQFILSPSSDLYIISPKVIISLLAGIISHELLHGFTWIILGKKRWKNIHFGFNWKHLSPYCHVDEAIWGNAYFWGALSPGIILGVLPLTVSLLTGAYGYFLWGLFFTLAGTADYLMAWKVKPYSSKNYKILDSENDLGCVVQKANQNAL